MAPTEGMDTDTTEEPGPSLLEVYFRRRTRQPLVRFEPQPLAEPASPDLMPTIELALTEARKYVDKARRTVEIEEFGRRASRDFQELREGRPELLHRIGADRVTPRAVVATTGKSEELD